MITTVLLPFAVQFIHSFEKHEYVECSAHNKKHIDQHSYKDCAVFHFNINHNSISFSSEETLHENICTVTKIETVQHQLVSIKINHKSPRAPPILL